MEEGVFLGVIAEISMKVRILRARLGSDPASVDKVISDIERLEEDLVEAIFELESH